MVLEENCGIELADRIIQSARKRAKKGEDGTFPTDEEFKELQEWATRLSRTISSAFINVEAGGIWIHWED